MKRFRSERKMPAVDPGNAGQMESAVAARPPSRNPSDWTDQQFCEAFESLKIPNEMFRHREHIRLAWIYSIHFSGEEALSRMVDGIRAFAKHHGAEAKYHHTITLAWMRLVHHAVRSAPPGGDFASFVDAHPHLLDPQLLGQYYSPEKLKSDAARHAWFDPDLRSLP
jgi:hypothetical protein